MQARSLFSFRTVVLFAVFFVAILPVNGYKNQDVNSRPRCCDQKLLTYNSNARECQCNQKEFYYESRDHKHCILCPPPKLWLNYECKECTGKFRVWSGHECVCMNGTSWDQQSKSCVCPKYRRDRAGANYCECIPPLVDIKGTCQCPDPLQIYVDGKCVCKPGDGIITKNDGTCTICLKPKHWFPNEQKCAQCSDQGAGATEFFNPTTTTCDCNSANPYRVSPGVCQPCPFPGAWNNHIKSCLCPPNYVWSNSSKSCQCPYPNTIKDGYCHNCKGGQKWVPLAAQCKCPKDKPNFYRLPGQSSESCHHCPRHLPHLGPKGDCQRCPKDSPNGPNCVKCAAGLYFYGGKCNKCPEVTPNHYNDTCHKCPQELPNLRADGKCYKCKQNQFEYDGKCNKCPKALFQYNNACNKCPQDQIQWSDKTCHVCPKNKQHFYDGTCHDCPKERPYLSSNRFCGCTICPDNLPYRYDGQCNKCQYGYTLSKDNICLRCSDQFYYNGRCHRCLQGRFFYDDKCNLCPKEKKYNFNGQCHKCPKERPFIIMNTCQPCQQGQEFTNNKCVQCESRKDYNPYSGKCDCSVENCYTCPKRGQKYNKKLKKCI